MTTSKRDSLIAHQQFFSIIDSALLPEPLWYAKGAGLPLKSLFLNKDKPLEDKGPWLINLQDAPDMMDLLLKQDVHGHGTLWCSSPLDIQSLSDQLTKRVYAKKPDGTITRFRFYDPRVLHHYLLSESDEKVGQFLQPFSRLTYASLNPFRFEHYWNEWLVQEQETVYLESPLYPPSTEQSHGNADRA